MSSNLRTALYVLRKLPYSTTELQLSSSMVESTKSEICLPQLFPNFCSPEGYIFFFYLPFYHSIVAIPPLSCYIYRQKKKENFIRLL
jgi:hypothetical protein